MIIHDSFRFLVILYWLVMSATDMQCNAYQRKRLIEYALLLLVFKQWTQLTTISGLMHLSVFGFPQLPTTSSPCTPPYIGHSPSINLIHPHYLIIPLLHTTYIIDIASQTRIIPCNGQTFYYSLFTSPLFFKHKSCWTE